MAITYCIVCNITGEKYYGSTIKLLKERMYQHKHSKSNTSYSKQIIVRNDYDIFQLGEYETELEARLKEKWYIDNKTCINKHRVCLTDEERKEHHKQYYQQNKEQICEKERNNYQEKKQKILEQKSEKKECEYCKSIVRRGEFARHQRTKKCLSVAKGSMTSGNC